jgi:DNA repair protein RadC
MNTKTPALPGLEAIVQPFRFSGIPQEYKIVSLRECPSPDSQILCDQPSLAADYWRTNITTNPYFNSECECLSVILLNTRRKIKGHQLLTLGTLDSILVSPSMVFRLAVVTSASAIIVMHNHPSGDPSPSAADINVTRELARAGQLLKVELLDHVIMGAAGKFCSLRQLGHFNS